MLLLAKGGAGRTISSIWSKNLAADLLCGCSELHDQGGGTCQATLLNTTSSVWHLHVEKSTEKDKVQNSCQILRKNEKVFYSELEVNISTVICKSKTFICEKI